MLIMMKVDRKMCIQTPKNATTFDLQRAVILYETDRPDGRDSRTVLHDFSAHTLASHSVATSPAPSNNTSNLNYLITYLLTCCQSQT